MKNLFNLIMATAITVLVAGCSDKPNDEEPDGGTPKPRTLSVNAISGSMTRTALNAGENAVLWEIGDKIGLFAGENTNLQMAQTGELLDNGARAVFEGTVQGELADQTSYYMYYPYNTGVSMAGSTLNMTFGNQQYVTGKVPTMPMAAKYTGTESNVSATFEHLFTILKLSVTKDALAGDVKVTRIDFSGQNGEKVSGNFTVDMSGNAFITNFSGSSGTSLSLDCGTQGVVLDDQTASVFYITVPAGLYSKGYKVVFETSAGSYEETSGEGDAVTLTKGSIYAVPAISIEFEEPTPVFTIPKKLYIHGTASEAGQEFRKTEDGIFEIFTTFPQDGTLYFSDGTDGDAVNYYMDTDDELKQGTGSKQVSKDADWPRRITVNFNDRTMTISEQVSQIKIIWATTYLEIDPVHIDLTYVGKGVLKIADVLMTIPFTHPAWGGVTSSDERYYFQALFGQDWWHWRRMPGISDGQPASDEPLAFYEIDTTAPWAAEQWNGAWKLQNSLHNKICDVVIYTNKEGMVVHQFENVR